jgi:hypothetical protein
LESFILRNLEATDYDINKPYSMAGLPKLTAFILWAQYKDKIPYEHEMETTITMRRWRTVRQYKKELAKPIAFPGEWPVHNPTNWGHTQYNEEVTTYLDSQIFDPMREKAAQKPPKHFTKKQVEALIKVARNHFWKQLRDIPTEPGGGGLVGIEKNLRNRYGRAKNGWWKPMCMSRSTPRPTSPSLR